MNDSHDKLMKFNANNIIHKTLEKKQKIWIPNTGAKGHYLQADAPYLPSTNVGPSIHVGWPNGKTIQSIKPCEVHIIPSLTHISLVSIGNICYSGCTSLFKAQELKIKFNVKIVIQVPRDRRNELWKIPLAAQIS